MQNRKSRRILQAIGLSFGVLFALFFGCVSRSNPSERFSQSAVLSSPSLSVTLADPKNFTFAFVGDLHINGQNTDRLRRILAAAAAEGDAFLVLLGDIADEGKKEDFDAVQTALSDLGFAGKTLYVIGNHDIFGEGWTQYRNLLGPTHYSVTVGNSRFLALDTADASVNEAESDWLTQELAKGGSENTFLLSHYAPVVPGVRTYLRLANEEEAARLMKLATLNGVTGWLSGHYHSFVSEKMDGVAYTIAGGGGGRRMEPVVAFFFAQATVSGTEVSYRYQIVE